jgi:hypothetical protein
MKVVFSRKGWDSGFGGKASPVFADGTIQSLPIECRDGSPRLEDVTPRVLRQQGSANLAEFLADYFPREDRPQWAHLDPDLDAAAYKRAPGWRPCFGQDSAAASHLDNQGVSVGDLFLFYGWYDDVESSAGRWHALGNHRFLIWGWLQVGEIFQTPTKSTVPAWLRRHPHAVQEYPLKNRIYVADETLTIDGQRVPGRAGGSIFGREHPARNLTRNPDHRGLYPDRIPAWLKMARHRQEHVWDISQSPAAAYLRSFFV